MIKINNQVHQTIVTTLLLFTLMIVLSTCNGATLQRLSDAVKPRTQDRGTRRSLPPSFDKCEEACKLHVPIIFKNVSSSAALKNIAFINTVFKNSFIHFDFVRAEDYPSGMTINELQKNNYDLYFNWADQVNTDTLTIFYFDSSENCKRIDEKTESCSLIKGFSLVASSRINNLVMSTYDSLNPLVLTHELGHFFGLKHLTNKSEDIADTPYHPSENNNTSDFYNCETLEGLPLNNFMSYYKPCYLKEKEFTKGQYERMYEVAMGVKNMVIY